MKKILAMLSIGCALAIPVTLAVGGTATAGEQQVCTEVVHHDAIPAVTHEETLPIQRYSYIGGVEGLDENGVPIQTTAPGSDWQANTTLYNDGTSDGGHLGLYFVSHGGSGNGDWFYWETGTVVIIDEPEVPAWDEVVEVPCPPTGPTGPTGPTPTPTPTPSVTPPSHWEPSFTPSWQPAPKVHANPTRHDLASTGLDVTGGLVAMELLGSIGFGGMALSRKRRT